MWFLIRFSGDDRSGVVSGETGTFLFLFLDVPLKPPSSLLFVSKECFLGVLQSERPLRFAPEAVISLKVCLDAPIFPILPSDDLGVKKRENVLGVTVGRFLGLAEFETGRRGEEGGSWLVVGLLIVVSMASENDGSWSAILIEIRNFMVQTQNLIMP